MLHASYDGGYTVHTMDDEGAGRIATNHLIELGHEKIALYKSMTLKERIG